MSAQNIDIETVADDVLAAEGWGPDQWHRAMRIAQDIVSKPIEEIITDGVVVRDLVLPFTEWDVAKDGVRLAVAK